MIAFPSVWSISYPPKCAGAFRLRKANQESAHQPILSPSQKGSQVQEYPTRSRMHHHLRTSCCAMIECQLDLDQTGSGKACGIGWHSENWPHKENLNRGSCRRATMGWCFPGDKGGLHMHHSKIYEPFTDVNNADNISTYYIVCPLVQTRLR